MTAGSMGVEPIQACALTSLAVRPLSRLRHSPVVPALGFEPRHYTTFEVGPSAVGVGRHRVVREGVEPPKPERLVYSELTSPMVMPHHGTPGRTRTHTDRVLSAVPLPLGYGSAGRTGIEPARVLPLNRFRDGLPSQPAPCPMVILP